MQVEIEPYSPAAEMSATPTPRFTTILLSSVFLVAGIGSGWSITQTGDVGSSTPVIVRPFAAEEGEAESETDPAIQRENLTKIRASLGLSMTEMAQVFNVSRTALYGWFNGTIPHAKQIRRINEVFSFAELAGTYQLQRMDLLKNIPLVRGKTLLQVLTSNEDVPGALADVREFAIARSVAREARLSRIARKEKIFGAEDITPSFSTFE
jgi:transcriptional regulator with XRE-family HTH domain